MRCAYFCWVPQPGDTPVPQVQGSPCTRPNLLSPPYLKEEIFIFFLSPERKPKQKKECENVLSSEAGTQILQITQRTRSAQTAFRISLLRLRTAIRNSILSQRICIPINTSSCGMFSSDLSRVNMKHEVRGMGASPH